MKLSVKKDKDSTAIDVAVTFDPSTLSEAIQHYHRDANMVVVAQGICRNLLKGTKTVVKVAPTKLQDAVDKLDWMKIFSPHARKSTVEKFGDAFASLSQEQQDEIRELLAAKDKAA